MIDVRPQVLLEGLVLPFGLTVILRVVPGTESPFDAAQNFEVNWGP